MDKYLLGIISDAAYWKSTISPSFKQLSESIAENALAEWSVIYRPSVRVYLTLILLMASSHARCR